MAHKKEIEENMEFVARYYRDNTLLPREGWKHFKAIHSLSNLRRNIAAAAIGVAIMATAATIYYASTTSHNDGAVEITPTPTGTEIISSAQTSRKIEFHDASLKEVVAEIERLYGVKVVNLPREEIRVTISYEGTAEDVITTINELFDTELRIDSAAVVSPDVETSDVSPNTEIGEKGKTTRENSGKGKAGIENLDNGKAGIEKSNNGKSEK